MKKRILIITVIVLVILIAIFIILKIYKDDHEFWNGFQKDLKTQEVLSIDSLSDQEKDQFVTLLKECKFERVNKRLEGSTGAVFKIKFKNGEEYSLDYWGGKRFELSKNKSVPIFILNQKLCDYIKDDLGVKVE